MGNDLSAEQKRFLEGFTSGLQAGRMVAPGVPAPAQSVPAAPPAPTGPDRAHLEAMARTEASGKKLVDQEKWKRDDHPFDAWQRLKAQAATNEYPKPPDNFRWRFYGLFYVAPNQPFYMCRLRIPNGVVRHHQLRGIADIAEQFGGGYAHVTTRANIQIREIEAKSATDIVEAIQDLGLNSRGSGADNIRNVTGDATAGIAAQELLDTRPYAREWHFHILNDRSLCGLPRKFNVAFDGAGPVPTLEETNDIAFTAVRVGEGAVVPAGIYFRLGLGGITGHRDLARDTGVLVPLSDAIKVADAIVRVFIDHGDRTNRAKARLKYVLDAWGFEKFLAAVEEKLGKPLLRVPAEQVEPRPAQDRAAHMGVHPQKQAGLNWVGVWTPVGRMSCEEMRVLADAAKEFGDGDIRLTVWQNLLISGVPDDKVPALEAKLNAAGLTIRPSVLETGLVACTGATGCKLANAKTKEIAHAINDWCGPRVALDNPVNIHITGCPNSCAQHYIGDIGLVGARVPSGDEGDTIDGYNVVVGGGYGADAKIGRDYAQNITAEQAPALVEQMLKAYLAHRRGAAESFKAFTERHDIAALRALETAGGR
jgi:ferredoxin-nitrite reductase